MPRILTRNEKNAEKEAFDAIKEYIADTPNLDFKNQINTYLSLIENIDKHIAHLKKNCPKKYK